MNKYHGWWLIITAVSVFIGVNYVMFALTGLMFIMSSSFEQALMQFLVFLFSTVISLLNVANGDHVRR